MSKKACCGLLVGCFQLLWISLGFGATRIYLPDAPEIKWQLKQVQTSSASELKTALGLGAPEGLKLLRRFSDERRVTYARYQQTFSGIPVWGHHVIVGRDAQGGIASLHGTRVLDIEYDVDLAAVAASRLTAAGVLAQMKNRHIEQGPAPGETWVFANEVSRKVVYVDHASVARICYEISFFADTAAGGHPGRPVALVDAVSGEILLEYEGLTRGQGNGPGGNLKIGRYRYGEQYPAFEVSQSGSTCIMETAKVKTVNRNHGSYESDPYAYVCYENTFKEINGAYSPLNDAHAFGAVVFDMYMNWYNTAPLTFKMILQVHYSKNLETAFWTGSEVKFGDGASHFHPLVSLDLAAHEVSHGFTEQHSGLIYSGQSGGINEAFSDMAGEAAEFYSHSSNDFMFAYDVKKDPGALRYLDDPPKDGISIGSAKDYSEGMDVHYSSGVFNKAFYTLATTPGWDTKKAFAVFVRANQAFWEPSTNFQKGAEGVRDAAISLGYIAGDVRNAFAAVDIAVTVPLAQYCAAQGDSQGYEWIKQVTVGGFTKASKASPYSDFTAEKIAVQRGQAVAVTLTPGFRFASVKYPEYWRVWADLNRDGDFDDAGELLLQGSSENPLAGSITIPAAVAAGATRLRVSMNYGGYPNPCGGMEYGEVEDYTLNID